MRDGEYRTCPVCGQTMNIDLAHHMEVELDTGETNFVHMVCLDEYISEHETHIASATEVT